MIPRHGTDINLGIDPFLLFKSRDPRIKGFHTRMVAEFNRGIGLIRDGKLDEAEYLFTVPEPIEIGLGYGEGSRKGSGIGKFLSNCILDAIQSSPHLQTGGIRHIEELQLYSVGIGPDRTSDLACGFLKDYLIEYTQTQCQQWGIDLSPGVPIEGIYNFEEKTWEDSYEDLPVSPVDGTAMLFVPRRIVRSLPFISYDDFLRNDMAAYLRRSRVKKAVANNRKAPDKATIVSLNRNEIERVEQYITQREKDASKAQPSSGYLRDDQTCAQAERLSRELKSIPTGTKAANLYHEKTLEILNFVFNPELSNGEKEVSTIHGTERRDIIFTNESDQSFWTYIRNEHSSIFLMFEVKNVEALSNDHVNQTATYLGERLGRLGVILTRNAPSKERLLKILSVYNDSTPRKIILVLSDHDLYALLDIRCNDKEPMQYIQNIYRTFRTKAQ